MKISKRGGIAIFSSIGILMGLIIVLHQNPGPSANPQEELLKKILSCAMILAACIVFAKWYEKFTTIPVELYQSRHLIWKLAKNDFKKRYAGSYMGALWALAQPVVTVGMYYIVIRTAGLVPWFYCNEALNNGTNALREYDYLVTKVVFKISILPIIKIIAATFIHVFFVGVLLLVAALYGYYPTVYTVQIVYYSFCLFIFVLALCYATCSVVVFFKDLTQIINIALQIGIWATPILWNIESAPAGWVFVLKLNPLVYVVEGYRSAIYGRQWFFQDFFSTMYFWIVTVVLFGLGAAVFRRLKVHFADVL